MDVTSKSYVDRRRVDKDFAAYRDLQLRVYCSAGRGVGNNSAEAGSGLVMR